MRSSGLFLICSMLLFGCSDHKATKTEAASIAAGHMPSIAKDAGNNIHLVYGNGDSIMYVASFDAGQNFGNPVLIDTLTDLIDYATRGPQVITTKNGLAIIAVNKQGDIFSYIKDMSGKWSQSSKVNDADTTNKEGFLALGSDGDSTLFAIWPDLRTNGQNKVYGARSTDAGRTWSSNMLVYASPTGSICECCKQSVIMQGRHVYVMFRNLIDGNRDLYLVQSNDAGLTFGTAQKLGTGSWHLDGCPMDGGGMAVTADNIQTTWRRRDSVFTATPGATEKFITKGNSSTITATAFKTVLAWNDDDEQIFYKLNDGQEKAVGNGKSQVLQIISDKKLLCVWDDNGVIKYSLFDI